MPFVPVLAATRNRIKYLLRDDFNDTRAAGSVNGTPATPGPGTRALIDTGNNVSISSGAAVFAGGLGSPVWTDPILNHDAISTKAGIVFLVAVNLSSFGTQGIRTGLSSALGSLNYQFGVWFRSTTILRIEDSGTAVQVGKVLSTTTPYVVAIFERTSGAHILIKGGVYTNFTLLWPAVNTVQSSNRPYVSNYNAACAVDKTRALLSAIRIAPLGSDSFNRADGVMGSTDGLGHAEADGNGAGLTWASQVGTWGISTSVAQCSVLSGGVGIAMVSLASSQVIHKVALTRAGGNVGIVFRFIDTNNYAYAYHDGTNVTCRQVVAGVDSQVIAAAAMTYSAGASLIASVDGTAVEIFYNNARLGAGGTLDAALTGMGVGLYTTDTGNSFDNLVSWARGNTENPYSFLDRFLRP